MRVIRRIEIVVLFILIAAAVVIGIRKYYLDPEEEVPKSKEFERYVSSYDTDGDGIDDQTDMLESARAYIETKPKYKSKYYSGGYPDDEYGVCTDVVAQAMLGTGFDLQELIDEDIKKNPQDYDIENPDSNIDFRRVPNQNVYFKNHAISLTKDLSETEEWQGGDIVVFEKHIGIISDRRGKDGVPYLIHHYKKGQKQYEENALKRWGKILGHYRINNGRRICEKIIQAMTTPDDKLFSVDAFTAIGEGASEETGETEAQQELEKNWEQAVGEYFAEGALEEFVYNGPATQYLGEAALGGNEMTLVEMKQEQGDEDSAYYKIVIKMGEEERTDKLYFSFNADGLIKEVRRM